MSLENDFILEGEAIVSLRSGRVADGTVNSNGYRVLTSGKKKYLYHRVKFYLLHGYLPHVIDHIDGDRLNNHSTNLREATYALNNHNTHHRKNTTGVKGVYLKFRYGKHRYRAKIVVDGKGIELGLFDDLASASNAYQEAVKKHYA